VSSDTTTEAGVEADPNEGGASAARTYGPEPAAAQAPATAPPMNTAPPVNTTPPSHKAPRHTGAPTMATVAYQQPESAGQPGPVQGAQPQPQPQGGATTWRRRPDGQPAPMQPPMHHAAGPGPGPAPQQQRHQQAPRGRKARLRIAKVDPWSVMKTTFVLAIALAIVSIVAVALLWSALNALGVFTSLNKTLASIAPAGQTSNYTLSNVLSFGKVISFTALVSVVNIVLFTALATLGAYLYNMCSSLVGGIEVTLADDTN
jgi:hypothetical protein